MHRVVHRLRHTSESETDEAHVVNEGLGQRAARGALYTIAASVGGRAVGVIGTLILTRFLAPSVVGEVSDATILCMTAGWLTTFGWGQYAIVKGRGPDALEVTWHATLAFLVPSGVALALVVLFASRLTPLFDAPHAAVYVPGMAVAIFIRRIGAMPERVLARDLRLKGVGLMLGLGEVSYSVTAVGCAMAGLGGASMVVGNLVQSCAVVGILVGAAGVRSWLTPSRVSLARIKDMLRFGLPIGVGATLHQATRNWDNLAVSHFFGPGPTGAYNMAYNLADIPAVQVGEQVAQVILPSMTALPPERRPRALERATALLSIVIFPMAVGLGILAHPLVSLVLPANDWQEVAPLLVILASLSVFRPMTWVITGYMTAQEKTLQMSFIEMGKVVALLGGIVLLAPFGLRVAACAVGISFGVSALVGVALVVRDGVSARRMVSGFVQPLAACAVMAAACWGVDVALARMGVRAPGLVLAADLVVGAAVYVAAAAVLARETSRELLALVGGVLRRRRAATNLPG